jgi:hypothetical protein
METQVEIPNFKLAKVGKDRERKKGGVPLWFGAPAGGGFSGAVGGLGAFGGKMSIALLAAILGAGAYGIGKVMAPSDTRFEARRKGKIFSSAPKFGGDLSHLPSSAKTEPSSLGYVTGSLDGKTPEQRAVEAEAENQVQADSGALAEAPNVQGGGTDASGLSSLSGGEKKSPFPNKIGNLSSGLSGSYSGLPGGAGLSGGIGRVFEAPKLQVTPPVRTSPFRKDSNATRAAARAVDSQSRAKGLARRQLHKAFLASQGARVGGLENRSVGAGAPFENNPGANSAITGGGTQIGGAPTGNPDGGPINPDTNPTDTGRTNQTQCSDGQITSGECAPVAKRKNATPWQGALQMAVGLLAGAMVMLGIAAYLAKTARIMPGASAPNFMMARIFAGIAAALAAFATYLGFTILNQGQKLQGGLLTGLGGIVTAASLVVMFKPEIFNRAQAQTATAINGASQTMGHTTTGTGATGSGLPQVSLPSPGSLPSSGGNSPSSIPGGESRQLVMDAGSLK